jgi:hypothetical protein
MAFTNNKWAFIAGAENFINGIGYMLGWFGANIVASYSSYFGAPSPKKSFDQQIGF